MEIIVRQEESRDFMAVFSLIERAFRSGPMSDHSEQFLVERLRSSETFIPELSLVAEFEEIIVGHILVTQVKINSLKEQHCSLALAPVSVLPEFQGKGIGEKLIRRAHAIAKDLGFTSIVLLGHENYYPRFGYKRASRFSIDFPFDVPKENCMVIELVENGLNGVSGIVEYPKEFNK